MTKTERKLVKRLREALAVLEFVGCPDKRPVSMKTCKVCWMIRDIRRTLEAVHE